MAAVYTTQGADDSHVGSMWSSGQDPDGQIACARHPAILILVIVGKVRALVSHSKHACEPEPARADS